MMSASQSGYDIRVNSIHPGCIWTPESRSVRPIVPFKAVVDIAYGVLFIAGLSLSDPSGT
jgi:hypothetical protein